jgi:protein-disulfide isomerase
MRRCYPLSFALLVCTGALSLLLATPARTTRNPDPRGVGNPDAPITIVEYSDYECPFCAEFAHTTRKQLIAEYVDTGKVYLLFRDNPLPIHPSAPDAAAVAACAADQGRFEPMHDRLFAGYRADEWGGDPDRDRGVILRYAAEIGLDPALLRACLADEATLRARIAADMAEAAERGLRGTPAFIIYHPGNPRGDVLHGMHSFSTWRILIDERLEGRSSVEATPYNSYLVIGVGVILMLLCAAAGVAALAWRTSRRVA